MKEVRNYEKWYTPKTLLKMAGRRMHTSHPTPLDPPLTISYRNHQKSLAYFSHLAPLILLFFTKRQSQKGGDGTMPPKYATGLHVPHFPKISSIEYKTNRLNN